MKSRGSWMWLRAVFLLTAGVCAAQLLPGGGRTPPRGQSGRWIQIEGGLTLNEDTVLTARETDTHSTGTPNWTNAPGFTRDVFTFVRVIFQSDSRMRSGRGWGPRLGWWVDYPDADLNLSYRLQQLTSIRTDPDARVLKLTDPSLHEYPLLYMEHAGYMRLSDGETEALRKYFAAGGALFVNDFWGAQEWEGFAAQIEQVLPGRRWTDLTMDHPVFQHPFRLNLKLQELQVPTVQFWNADHDPRDPESHLQRVFRGEGSEDVHIRALLDDRQRIQVLAIHNSDVSDGWEREGENEQYFEKFSEKIAYPLGINIIFHLMTH
jgi:hypothetical protein